MSAINHILKTLEEAREDEIKNNGAGAALDWPDYKRRVGRAEGLKRAIDLIDDAKRKLQREGDLDGE